MHQRGSPTCVPPARRLAMCSSAPRRPCPSHRPTCSRLPVMCSSAPEGGGGVKPTVMPPPPRRRGAEPWDRRMPPRPSPRRGRQRHVARGSAAPCGGWPVLSRWNPRLHSPPPPRLRRGASPWALLRHPLRGLGRSVAMEPTAPLPASAEAASGSIAVGFIPSPPTGAGPRRTAEASPPEAGPRQEAEAEDRARARAREESESRPWMHQRARLTCLECRRLFATFSSAPEGGGGVKPTVMPPPPRRRGAEPWDRRMPPRPSPRRGRQRHVARGSAAPCGGWPVLSRWNPRLHSPPPPRLRRGASPWALLRHPLRGLAPGGRARTRASGSKSKSRSKKRCQEMTRPHGTPGRRGW